MVRRESASHLSEQDTDLHWQQIESGSGRLGVKGTLNLLCPPHTPHNLPLTQPHGLASYESSHRLTPSFVICENQTHVLILMEW